MQFILTRKRLSLLLCIISAAAILISCTKKEPSSEIGQPAPDFVLTDITGKNVRLSDMKGRVVMIEFWATWCPPCKESAPVLNELYKKYKDKGFTLLGVSIDKGEDIKAAVSSFAGKLSISYPVLLDTDNVGQTYNISNIPSSFMIDKKGVIAYKHLGYFQGIEIMLSKEVETLL